MKYLPRISKVLFFIFIPSFIAYLSSDYSILDYWQEQQYLGARLNLPFIKQCLLFISVILTTGYLALNIELTKQQNSIILAQRAALINQLKMSTLYYLEGLIDDKYITTAQIRAWSEKKNTFHRLKKNICHKVLKRCCQLSFYEQYIEGLTKKDTSGLYFEVSPLEQGLVGVCYRDGEIKYEEDFSLVYNSYNLNSFQVNQLRSLKFYLCAPIYDIHNKIVAIISFESIYSIKIDLENERSLANALTNFCQVFYKNCPELFNRR